MSILTPLDHDGSLFGLDEFLKHGGQQPRENRSVSQSTMDEGQDPARLRHHSEPAGSTIRSPPPDPHHAMLAEAVGLMPPAPEPLGSQHPYGMPGMYDVHGGPADASFVLPSLHDLHNPVLPGALPGFCSPLPPQGDMLSSSPPSMMAGTKKRRIFSEEDDSPVFATTRGAKERVGWAPNETCTIHRVFDEGMNEISQPGFRVEIDKGMKRSYVDEAWICQKKNHFQVTVAVKMGATPKFVATRTGLLKVSELAVEMYGIRVEKPTSKIMLAQSSANRQKNPYVPMTLGLDTSKQGDMVKHTIGRLHFSETTANNMRKKGKRHPDQRHFALIVSLSAKSGDEYYPIVSHTSDKLIVRASNPAQFEPDAPRWQTNSKGSLFHHGNVGINTEHATDALCVHGNIRVTGNILQPSDRRIKRNLVRLDSQEQLKTIRQLDIYSYDLDDSWTAQNKGACGVGVGVIAQELRGLLPDAVEESGLAVELAEESIDNLLVVNKDRVLMETIGAVKQLAEELDVMRARVKELEAAQADLPAVAPALPTSGGPSWLDRFVTGLFTLSLS